MLTASITNTHTHTERARRVAFFCISNPFVHSASETGKDPQVFVRNDIFDMRNGWTSGHERVDANIQILGTDCTTLFVLNGKARGIITIIARDIFCLLRRLVGFLPHHQIPTL